MWTANVGGIRGSWNTCKVLIGRPQGTDLLGETMVHEDTGFWRQYQILAKSLLQMQLHTKEEVILVTRHNVIFSRWTFLHLFCL